MTDAAGPRTAGDQPDGRVERIALSRATAILKPDTIVIRPSRSALLGPAVQVLLTGLAAWAIVRWMDRLPLWVLVVLLVFVIIFGPVSVLGLVYNVLGSAFLMERKKGTCRWQQGFLGLGLGTRELVPFPRIDRIEVRGDFEDELGSGDLQDLVEWDVNLVKDNARVLSIASITSARPLADEALVRANALGAALAEMCGKPARLGAIPEWALEDYLDPSDADEDGEAEAEVAPDGVAGETMDEGERR